MTVLINYKNISVSTISDENVEKCVELRESQSEFFFGNKPDRQSSRDWILAHREMSNDVLFQIEHSKTGVFLGTIGFVNRAGEVEVGRLAVYARGVHQLLQSGGNREDIGEIGLCSCIALLRLILHTQIFDTVCAEVLATNTLSNRLCKEECGVAHVSYKEVANGEKIKILFYRMTKEEIRDKYGNEKMDIFFT